MALTPTMGIPHPDTASCAYKTFRTVRRPHSRLILHFRGLGKNSQDPNEEMGQERPQEAHHDVLTQFEGNTPQYELYQAG